jgi:predicted esterase
MSPVYRTRYLRSGRRVSLAHLASIFAILVVVALGGILLAGQGAPTPAGAAPGSRDGLSRVVLSRDDAPPAAVAAPAAASSVTAPASAPVASAPAPVDSAPAPAPAQAVNTAASVASAPAASVPERPGASEAQTATRVAPSSDLSFGDFYVHVPLSVEGRLKVVVALHGIGGEGRQFCDAILARAEREGWVVVAPTYAYGDWRDPNQVAREESARLLPQLRDFLQELPARTGLDLEPKAALLGFSRGAQLAQRFAIAYPELTQSVVAFSAGSYTLPMSQTRVQNRAVRLAYPFGTADLNDRFGRPFDSAALQRIPFLVGVGADDRNPGDLPRQWDPYIGNNRVARAEAFTQRLTDIGVPAELALFPGVGHALTDPMRARALDFIAAQ